MKNSRKSDSPKVQQPPREKRPEISAPRHRSTWEPIPLHVPVPDLPERPKTRADESQPRGVLIIQYGDDS